MRAASPGLKAIDSAGIPPEPNGRVAHKSVLPVLRRGSLRLGRSPISLGTAVASPGISPCRRLLVVLAAAG